jgi:hypothetical protein
MSKSSATPAPAEPSTTAPAPYDPDNPLGLPEHLDPADYDWYPVARRKRADGWTHTRQRKFIEVLADTGSVREAAKLCHMSLQSCYRLRRSRGAEAFARAWDAAIEEASRRLVDVAFERALHGVADPVFDKEGACIAVRRRYNDRLLMFLLRAHQPERYRYAHGDLRRNEEPERAAPEPVAAALELLSPPVPADPAALVPPEDLEERLMIAETLDGKLPGWLEDRGGDCDLEPEQLAPDMDQRLKRIMRADRGLRDPDPDRERLERWSHLL